MSDTTTITVVAGDGEEILNPVTATVTVIGTVPNGPPGASGSGVPAGGTDGQVLTKKSATDGDADWEDPTGGGAPTTADYLVGTAQVGLSAEIVVGTSPGGELGGTWASPTVDATHSGSSHASVQAAAEAAAADALSGHEAAANPHPGYLTPAEGNAAYDAIGAAATVDAALTAHIGDTADAHDASAISILDTANDFTATDVEGALAELQSDHETDATALADHIADTSAAHAASAVSADSTTLVGTGTDVQAVLEELDNAIVADETALANHLADTSDAHDASAISILDTANDFTATNVEDALAELQTADEADEAALAAHLADTSDAHDASAVSVADTAGLFTATDVEGVLAELKPWIDRGIYVAERSLRRWRQTRNPHIVWMGDSTVNGDVGGFDLTNGGTGSPTELLGQMFQGSGPFLGPGFYGLWRDEWVFTAGGAAFTQASATDTWDVGPFFSARKSTGSSTTLATFAIPRTIDPTHADIMFWDDTVTADANWSYATSLDGTTFTAFTNSDQHWVSGLPYVSRQRLALPSGTTHIRVKASNAANTQKDITLLGVMLFTQNPGTGNGVIVSNLGASADLLGTFIRDTDGSPLRTVWALQPTLAIIGPFTNDSPTGFGPLLRKLIAGLRSRTVYDIATTSGSPTVTSATANFTDADRGKNVSGTGLGLGGFTIIDVVNSTTITTSSNATQTNTGVTVSITPNRNKIGQDLVTVNGSRVVDAATGNFMQADVGRVVSATGVPASTRIARVNSSTQVVLTAAATASATVAYLLYDSGTTYPKQVLELEPDILLIGQFNQQTTITRPNVVTTNTSTTVTGPAGTFHANMVNRGFTGTGLNAFTRLASVESDTSATLTIAATASGTITATLAGRTQSDIDDLRAATKAVARGYIGEDGTAVDGDATYTVTGAAFVSHDRGKRVVGWGIPENTFIDTVTNGTTIELSRPAVGDGTGHFEMEGYGYLDMGEAWYSTGEKNAQAGLLWDSFHEAQRGHREMANAVKRLLDTFS